MTSRLDKKFDNRQEFLFCKNETKQLRILFDFICFVLSGSVLGVFLTLALGSWETHSVFLFQDMCVVCGSFGLGAEGRLLACAQCGQCYHPFCVGIKV